MTYMILTQSIYLIVIRLTGLSSPLQASQAKHQLHE